MVRWVMAGCSTSRLPVVGSEVVCRLSPQARDGDDGGYGRVHARVPTALVVGERAATVEAGAAMQPYSSVLVT
jgi:hypothetical protein